MRVLGNPGEKIGDPQALLDQNGNLTAENAHVVGTSANKPLSKDQQPPQHHVVDHRGNKSTAPSPSTFPIEGLSPYQNNWTIKARVTQKSDIKTWSNQRGEGKLFSVTLMDDTGEIKATAFNTVADELFSRLEEGKVYYLSKARVNFAKKKFSNLSNDYELTLDRNTHIEEVSSRIHTTIR